MAWESQGVDKPHESENLQQQLLFLEYIHGSSFLKYHLSETRVSLSRWCVCVCVYA